MLISYFLFISTTALVKALIIFLLQYYLNFPIKYIIRLPDILFFQC